MKPCIKAPKGCHIRQIFGVGTSEDKKPKLRANSQQLHGVSTTL